MDRLSNFERSNRVTKCCDLKKNKWQFIVNIKCMYARDQNVIPSHSTNTYVYCASDSKLYCTADNGKLFVSGHNGCINHLADKYRKQFLIDEIRELYNKLRIIEPELTADCIRYIVLAEFRR